MPAKHPCLTHLALHVRDINQCRSFYERYCQLQLVHERHSPHSQVLWMAETGKEKDFVLVLIGGKKAPTTKQEGFSHLGFAVRSPAEVDAIAQRAKQEGILEWPPVEEPFPVGYYCGVSDPEGHVVEFSFGQPLGEAAS